MTMALAPTFPISREPPEGGTPASMQPSFTPLSMSFQFLGIPPKGEQSCETLRSFRAFSFPISRDPPEGGTFKSEFIHFVILLFPISRDPPEGGTIPSRGRHGKRLLRCFQFLGIPPKGELQFSNPVLFPDSKMFPISRDPPEGGTVLFTGIFECEFQFPISRDPPEGGT